MVNDKQGDNKQHWKCQQQHQQHCSEYILRALLVANIALTYADFGKIYRYGTLRNEMMKLVEQGKILSLPKEWPKRFILRAWANRPEYASVIRNDKRSRVGRFDVLSYLEGLPWSSSLCVHNLKLCFQVFIFRWSGPGWEYCAKNRSSSKFLDLSYPVKVQCYDTGTVMVSIKSSTRPFPLDNSGLLALSSLLGEIKYSLHAQCIPEPGDWEVVYWHLNRDTKPFACDGLDVHLTFRDFFGDAAQFYNKRSLNVMRAEVIQTPKKSVQEVFEKIINRDNFGGGGRLDA